MKMFLRHRSTGQYFQALNRWTLDRDSAHDFRAITRAMRVARKLKVAGLEVVLAFDDPAQRTPTSFRDLWPRLFAANA